MTTIGLSSNKPNNTDDAADASQLSEAGSNTAKQPDEARRDKARSDRARKHHAPSDEAGKKRIPLLWIAATLGIGLFIAAIYLGSRIFTAHSSSNHAMAPGQPPKTGPILAPALSDSIPPPPAAVFAEPVPASAIQLEPVHLDPVQPNSVQPNSVQPNSVQPNSVQNGPDDPLPMIAPHSGQRYIQIGALDAAATRRFIRHLRTENLEPHVAPGPTPELMRVLIGPFDSTAALNERQAQLESEGIDTFVRQY